VDQIGRPGHSKLPPPQRYGALFGAAFLMAFAIQLWWLALPFIGKSLGASDAQIGLAFAANMLTYAVALLLACAVLERFNPKRQTQCGAALAGLAVLLMAVVLPLCRLGVALPGPIYLIAVAAGIFGLATTFFWPPLVGWLSLGVHGQQLNARLGVFSISWSLATFLGPLIGGYLVEFNLSLPVFLAVAVLLATFTALSLCPKPPHPGATSQPPPGPSLDGAKARVDQVQATTPQGDLPPWTSPGETSDRELLPAVGPPNARLARAFLWMSRLALFGSFACVGLFRTQLALLFTIDLGFSESTFGLLVAVMAASSVVLYAIIGRTPRWHYRLGWFVAAQVLTLAALLTVSVCSSLWLFFLAATVLGVGYGFAYASHLFYATSANSKRSTSMAIHELTLAAGMALGAYGGGYLSDLLSRRSPYVFASVLLGTISVAQLLVYLRLTRPTHTLDNASTE